MSLPSSPRSGRLAFLAAAICSGVRTSGSDSLTFSFARETWRLWRFASLLSICLDYTQDDRPGGLSYFLTSGMARRIVNNLGMSKPSDLIQGTLDLLILSTLALEPKHGWAVAKRIELVSEEVLQVTQGALYPALHRLEQQGWISASWRNTETGREAKFYELTKAGRVQLEKELAQWARLSKAVGLVIRTA